MIVACGCCQAAALILASRDHHKKDSARINRMFEPLCIGWGFDVAQAH